MVGGTGNASDAVRDEDRNVNCGWSMGATHMGRVLRMPTISPHPIEQRALGSLALQGAPEWPEGGNTRDGVQARDPVLYRMLT